MRRCIEAFSRPTGASSRLVDVEAERGEERRDDVAAADVVVDDRPHPVAAEDRLDRLEPAVEVEVDVVVVADVAAVPRLHRLGEDALLQEVLAADVDDHRHREAPGGGVADRLAPAPAAAGRLREEVPQVLVADQDPSPGQASVSAITAAAPRAWSAVTKPGRCEPVAGSMCGPKPRPAASSAARFLSNSACRWVVPVFGSPACR